MTAPVDDPPRWRRHRRTVGRATLIFLLLLLLALWLGRQRIAAHLIDEHLAKAGVPASYRITRLTPFSQRIENVRIGDAAHPDLVARRIDLGWRYGLDGPVLASVDAEGVRLAGAEHDGRLSLGTIDRLLPQSSAGGPALPDMAVTIADTHVAVATAAGLIGAWLTGSGNLANGFAGTARVDAPTLAIGGCRIARISAGLTIRIADRSPHIVGPVAIGGTACRPQALMLGSGTAQIDMTLAPTLDQGDGRVALAGFAGHAGSIGIGGTAGTISLAGSAQGARGRADLRIRGVQSPIAHARIASIAGSYRVGAAETRFDGAIGLDGLSAPHDLNVAVISGTQAGVGTPLGPIAARIGTSIAGMLSGADGEAQIAYVGSPVRQSLRIDQAAIRSRHGDRFTIDGSGTSENGGWTFTGHFSGKALPAFTLDAARRGAKAPLTATVRMAPYAADGARLAITPLQIQSVAGTTRFATTATITGPLGAGSIEDLTMPIAATLDRAGGLSIGTGCTPISFTRLRLAALTLDPGRVTVCGQPLLQRSPGGAMRIALAADDVALTGLTGTTPLILKAAHLGLTGTTAFEAEGVAVALGATDDDPTHLTIAKLDGSIGPNGPTGTFADAAGSIRHVPLALSGATGSWRFDAGALRLDGKLGVADRGDTPRFSPLTSGDVKLALVDGRIDASASLRTPRFDKPVAMITLTHDLASGSGGAHFDVPGLTFAKTALQPEMLTPLTLGVIANTSGTVAGQGRIDWSADAVTSSGDFHTDRIDFAAAFGPVSGVSGKVHFTDLLGLVSAPHQEVRIAEVNPGVVVANGVANFQLLGSDRVRVEDAAWPFAGGSLTLDPTTLDFSLTGQRRLVFQVKKLDAGAFIQQLDFPNISATGTFDGKLPIIFDTSGGRIEGGMLTAERGGQLAYVGELSNAELGTMGKLAFDALKAIHYSNLTISLDGRLDGEIVSRVSFQGVRQVTANSSLVARMVHNLPFRFNIAIRAPFRGLVGSAQAYMNPGLLLREAVKPPPAPATPPAGVQPVDSGPVR